MPDRCLGNALRIGKLPMDQWKAELAKLPEVCPHADCKHGSCRALNREYLLMQRKCRIRRAELKS